MSHGPKQIFSISQTASQTERESRLMVYTSGSDCDHFKSPMEGFGHVLDVVVPKDLWTKCKRSVNWPVEEPRRVVRTNAPFPTVRIKYDAVIEILKK